MTPELKKLQQILNISDDVIRYNKKFFDYLVNPGKIVDGFDENTIQEIIDYIKQNYNWIYSNGVFVINENDNTKLMVKNLTQSVITQDVKIIALGENETPIDISISSRNIVEIIDSEGAFAFFKSLVYSKRTDDIQAIVNQLTADNISGWESNISPSV